MNVVVKLLGNYVNKDRRFKPGDLSERRNFFVNDTGILEKEIPSALNGSRTSSCYFFSLFLSLYFKMS